ncbi:hypotjetical protein [Burkholderiales bacterium GJ-E10]|nr:hypotjetical protein [Burkholderiales bacterium GJ-E10]
MSARAAAWAWGIVSAGRIPSPSGKLVLLKMADRADPEGRCWPGHERTAADCGLSESSVKAALRDLTEAGLLSVERRRDAQGRDLPNIYLLSLPPLESETEAEARRAPKSPAPAPVEDEGDLWGLGVQILRDAGLASGTARAFLGSLLKSWDRDVVLDSIRASAGAADPRAYILGFLKDKPKKGRARNAPGDLLQSIIDDPRCQV